jgi:hypothetical protein
METYKLVVQTLKLEVAERAVMLSSVSWRSSILFELDSQMHVCGCTRLYYPEAS